MNSEQSIAGSHSRLQIFTAYIQKQGPASLISGLGGALIIWLLAQLTSTFELAMLVAPFGASCVLLFAVPQSPLAHPRNVIGGHFLSALVGLIVVTILGVSPLSCGIGVGFAIAVMQFTGTLHPPAGGNPLVVMFGGAGWSFLLMPILAGTVALILAAWLYHRFISHRNYPA